ncbi:DUF3099 domain-containing protein [Corynebacterium poyangense]|uniref:DUF3099 domain-containing protein n=1 Tax=Corynebacterium poyangense TaxID=2684405 RepID=A0A7H0SP87_9CORY|nr:DUF3099 domain-containing protein [Corynebacterium poyangense]MBZ8177934.1 DUF3099 domain-containing protein [Corynebacterium poyangense]QNQ90362.1 DUF3099 domain-containing protein [Corynebacterium poyangense]
MNEETIDDVPEEPDHTNATSRQPDRPAFRWGISKRRAQLITDARRSPQEDLKHRERLYAWIQLSRIPLIILALLTYWWLGNMWLSASLFLISIPLPWIAVVFANLRGEPRDKRAPKVYKPALAREQHNPQLSPPQRPSLAPPPEHSDNLPIIIDHSEPSDPEGQS